MSNGFIANQATNGAQNGEDAALREDVTDLELPSAYIKLEVGAEADFTIERLEKVTPQKEDDKRFNLSGVDYKYELKTTEDKTLTVNTWALFKEVRNIKEKHGKLKGLHVKVTHPEHGKYTISVLDGA